MLTPSWRSVDDDCPGWEVVGKTVEARYKDGEMTIGELEGEAWFNGEEEIAILSIHGLSFYDFHEWRIVG